MSRILYVINPAGRGGAGVKVWERVQATWSDRLRPPPKATTSWPLSVATEPSARS
jgi:hypothetical protein